MLVLILLIIIMVTVVYLITKKENNKATKMKNKIYGDNINESTFNPNYKISKDVNGLEIVQNCGR